MILSGILESSREGEFLVRDNAGEAVVFMDLSLRYDYVPGATKSPVAYAEGLYVKEAGRKQGIAARLIRHAEKLAFDRQCRELASDALIENTDSHHFHRQKDFREVERVVAFIKPLQSAAYTKEAQDIGK